MASEHSGENDEPVPTTEVDVTPQANATPSNVTEQQWLGMQNILTAVYDHRTEDGHDPSKVFHRKVNKRALPNYYDVIKEPIALSTVKAKINTRAYKDFAEFVRDFALIPHNAQVYNRPDAGAYQDALEVKSLLEAKLQQLVSSNVISAEIATLPYLGEIPPPDDIPADEVQENEEEEEEEDDSEEDDGADESDDSRGKKRGRGRPKGSKTNPDRDKKEDTQKQVEGDLRKKRNRPPRVDTPMEARIKNVMKAMRKSKNETGQLMISHFERLPDKLAMPEYFNEIKNPMAVDVLKKKLKRKKYQTFEQFMKDVDLMFENAKQYNLEDSQIYKDAVELQSQMRAVGEEEQKKPDSDYIMEDGRLPLPEGILHNGELYKVGDWVHIQNANDLTKPIVTQIYRTWQDSSGQKFVNACWYYRPEQTVHRFDRHFFDHEVVKTGQYRDHSVDEIVDRCFVMFVTRFNKGRPRGFPPDKEVYVCEARYNEEKHTLNKIKTWASCLPDEVRDKDYEMELFEYPKKMKKQPSPIAYLLKEDAKETDDLPKPEWGADNAPPKIGAVHKRPRDPKDSPPPEPTPSPPPEPTPPPPTQRPRTSVSNQVPNGYSADRTANIAPSTANRAPVAPAATPQQNTPLPVHQPAQTYQQAPSPAQPMRQMPELRPDFSAHTPATSYSNRMQQPNESLNYPAAQRYQYPGAMYPGSNPYVVPQSYEVWHLGEANRLIPQEIRENFQTDDSGKVLFFTVPPIDATKANENDQPPRHSEKYLELKAKREVMIKEKRKREADEKAEKERLSQKTARLEKEAFDSKMRDITQQAWGLWEKQMIEATARLRSSQDGYRA